MQSDLAAAFAAAHLFILSMSFPLTRQVILIMLLTFGGATYVAGQSQESGQSMPLSLVTAEIPLRAQIDWTHYDIAEDCIAAFERVLLPARMRLDSDTLRDTVRHDNPWIPLPATALNVGRQCLRRFRVAELPTLALPSALKLAVAVNADTVAQSIVARQLMLVHGVPARAAVLDSAVDVLMRNQWGGMKTEWNFTPAHMQLAHIYIAQINALGDSAVKAQIMVRERLQWPAQYANDIDTQLAIEREITPLITVYHRIWPDSSWPLEESPGQNSRKLLDLTYLQSLTHEDLLKVAQVDEKGYQRFGMESPRLLGTPAPSVTGDYVYNIPAGTLPTVPSVGKISVLVFMTGVGAGQQEAYGLFADLRRLHRELPDVAITVVVKTAGTFGNQSFADHPEQEAVLLQHYYTDSLKLPGTVSVIGTKFSTIQNGLAVPMASPLWEAYRLSVDQNSALFVVDPTGIVVSDGDGWRWVDCNNFIHRLHDKFNSRSSSTIPH